MEKRSFIPLSYLKHLPIDEIKIDKLFVDDIHDQSKQGSIVKAIIDMGHSLNFTLIAEGIEKREQAKFLRVNECELGQGYYFCKPLPAEEITILLRDAVVYDIN
jgi:EAL domain-containing protein (putative c-di-GMP-specific phosphodiesterase class I)